MKSIIFLFSWYFTQAPAAVDSTPAAVILPKVATGAPQKIWFEPIPIEDYAMSSETKIEFDRAKTLTAAGREDQALISFADFLRRYPRHTMADDAQLETGLIYFNRQRYDDALVELQKVLSYTGKGADRYAEAALKIGECWAKLKNPDFARIEWQAVIRKFPGSAEAKKAEELLFGL